MSPINVFVFTFLLIASCKSAYSFKLVKEKNTVVKIPEVGKIQGTESKSSNGKLFYAFEGIPYARPPVGNLRFKEPKKAKRLSGTLIANNSAVQCLQFNLTNEISGVEDCLYLHVYTPSPNSHRKLDVIVFIHGGGFLFSYGGFYRPDYVLNEDVVYVTINYRLGILGFLSTESDLVPGNNGIKDQIMALQWIQKHIKHFGGNPDSVTITGTSAGGSSVHTHMLTPKSKGLFHKAIPRSGVVTDSWSLSEAHLEKTIRLGEIFGCDVADLEKLVDCLRAVDGTELVNSTQLLFGFPYGHQNPFAIAVDTWASDPIFPEHPHLLMKSGKIANDVPVLISYVGAEGTYPGDGYYDDDILQIIDSEWNKWIPYILLYEYTVEPALQDEVSQKIRQKFFGNEAVTKENFCKLIDLIGERYFTYEIYKSMYLLNSALKSPIYFNYFDYEGAESIYTLPWKARCGVGHYADVGYVFKTDKANTSGTYSDRRILEKMVTIFTHFAKTGKAEWNALRNDQKEFTATGLIIEKSGKVGTSDRNFDNWKFWESLPIMENAKLFE